MNTESVIIELLEALKGLADKANVDDVQPPFDAVFPFAYSSQSKELEQALKKAKEVIIKYDVKTSGIKQGDL